MQSLLRYWNKFTTGSTNRQIFGAAITVALMTVFVKAAAVGKELVVAWRFGTGDELDAFLIAFIIPSFIINVVAGSFNAALIPAYVRVREQEGLAMAQRLFSSVMVWSLGLLSLTTLLMVAAAPLYLSWIAQGFSPEKLSLTFHLLCLIGPVVPISGMVVIWGAILNAGERFALAALSPVFTPALSVFFLLLVPSLGIFALAVGLVCGLLLEMIILGLALKRQRLFSLPKWYGFDQHLRQVSRQYTPMLAGAFLMSSTSVVDQAMAAMLSPGSVAALNYGYRVISFPISLATTALGAAVIPYFSKMVAQQDWGKIRHTLQRSLSLSFVCSIPITGFIILFSTPIVQLLFQRGSFTENDTGLVSQIQALFALQIPFVVGSILLVRLISSLQENRILMWGALLNLLSNVILNFLLMKKLGVAGIALSTSCVMMISFCFLLGNCLYFSKINLLKRDV